ncbi:hypothetical protein [Saccharothrix variisporea]|uniref:hypothetical protein n=1 Tax=Saccharothrix variisporea TaxID=543527 RepID=UPI0011C41BF8|nr:hypothetical protein [Saccharothrix variisporea]
MEIVEGFRLGGLRASAAPLCLTCERRIREAIMELPGDYVRLALVLGKGGSSGDEAVSASRELPTPLRLGVEALQAEMVDIASTWAEAVAAVSGVAWDTQAVARSRPGVVLDVSVHMLADRLPVLLNLRDVELVEWSKESEPTIRRARCVGDHWADTGGPCAVPHPRVVFHDGRREAVTKDGVEGALDLADLHRRARGLLGVTVRTYRLREACPECGVQALTHVDGADVVDCGHCGVTLEWDEFRRRTDPLAGYDAGAA